MDICAIYRVNDAQTGKWLANLGFKPTGRVTVITSAQGELILKFFESQ